MNGSNTTVEDTFKDAFVEIKFTSTQIGAVPYLPRSFFDTSSGDTRTYIYRFGKIWFNNCLSGDDWVCEPNNKFHAIGIYKVHQTEIWGFTEDDSNLSVMSSGQIEESCAAEAENCKQHTATHEIGHQFQINVCSGIFGEHDQELAWCSNPPTSECNNRSDVQCTMYSLSLSQRTDGIDRFEINDLFSGYCPYQPDSIRKAKDPK